MAAQGDVQIKVTAEDQATGTLQKVNASLDGLAGGASLADSAVGKFIGKAAYFAGIGAAVYAVSEAVQTLATNMVSYNAKMEQTAIAYQTFLGNSGAAKDFIDDMKDFAARTPFEFEDVDRAAKKFMAFGWAAKDVIPDLTAVGNAAAALGINREGIDRITLALGQMSIKAKLSGEEVRQLNEAGISAQKYLADAFQLTGDAFDDLSKTGISGVQGMRAILDGMRNDPKFAGMMEKQSQTMIGLWSTIKDNMKEITGKMGEDLFASLQGWVSEFASFTSQAVTVLREGGLTAAMQEFLPAEWSERLTLFAGTLSDIGYVLGVFGGAAADVFGYVFGAVIDVANAADSLANTIGDGLASAFTALTTTSYPALNTIFDLAGSMVGVFTDLEAVTWGLVSAYVAYNAEMLIMIGRKGAATIETLALTAAYVREALALGEVGLAMGLLSGPAGWAAIAVGGLTAGLLYYSSDKMMGDAQNASDFYAGNFDQVAGAADNAAAAILGMTRAQQHAAAGIGGEYEDFTSRQASAAKDNRRYYSHTGITPIPAGAGKQAASSVAGANKYENQVDKMENLLASLDEKLMEAIGTKPQSALAKLEKEVTKWKNDIDKAAAAGVDTTTVQQRLGDYQKTQQARIKLDLLRAQASFSADILQIDAVLSKDRGKIARAEYEAALTKLDKEKEDHVRAGMEKQAVDLWYEASRLKIEQNLVDKQKENERDKLSAMVELHQARLDMAHASSEASVEILRQDLAAYKEKLQEQLRETTDFYARLKLIKEIASIQSREDDNPLTKDEGVKAGLLDALEEFGTEAKNWKSLAKGVAVSMRDSFQDFFFDTMTGQLKSLSEYFTSFLKGIAKSISQLMANAFATRIIKLVFGDMFRASGGPVAGGSTYVVGERGPEIFTPSTSGTIIPNHAISAAVGGTASSSAAPPAVTVNVVNNTGTQATATASQPKWDGYRFVVDVVMDAYARDVNGMRTVMAGGR